MRAGPLDRLVTIQRKTLSESPSGEPIESWANIADRRPASMAPVRGEERFGGDQYVASEQIEFRIRYSSSLADLSPLDRVIYPALDNEDPPANPVTRRVHEVMAVHEIGRREGLRILTARRPDVTT